MRAHETQIEADGPFFAMTELFGPEAMGFEFYRLAKGKQGPLGPDGFEEDLFAGVPAG